MVKEYIRQVNANVQESYISLILGFLVVVVGGVLLYNFFTKRTIQEQTPNAPVPTVAEEITATVSGVLTGTQASVTPSRAPSRTPTRTPSLTPKPTITAASTVQPTVTKTSTGQVTAQPDSMHIAQKGETLWALSERYYGTGFEWPKIAQANMLANPSVIEVEQKLIIPGGTAKGAGISATAIELPKRYTVVEGDSLWKIADRYYGTGFEWPLIAQENKLQNPRLIYPGNTLQLPRRSTTLDPPGR